MKISIFFSTVDGVFKVYFASLSKLLNDTKGLVADSGLSLLCTSTTMMSSIDAGVGGEG